MSEAPRDEATAAPVPVTPPHLRQVRRVVPLALLAVFAVGKLELNPVALDERHSDGLFYYQIAQHVAAGDGLLTSVSLYNQGLRALPAPTSVQPLWPLVLGWAGRAIGLPRAAALLPEALYLVSLLLLYLLANRIGRALGAEIVLSARGVPLLDLGSLLLAILGANSVYRAYTSLAYSEGLAMTLLFAALLALPGSDTRRAAPRAGLAGLLAGLAYLTRSQLILVPLALAASLALAGVRAPRLRRAALACLGAALAPVAAWIAYLERSLSSVPPAVLVNFAAYRETPGLPAVPLTVAYHGPLDRALDFLRSFAVAFDPTHFESYVTSFGPVALAVPAAAAVLLVKLAREPGIASALDRTVAPAALPALAACLAAAAALAPVHAAHMALWIEWQFGWRHGLPLVLALAPALALLVRSGRVARLLAVGAVVVGIAAPATRPGNYLAGNRRATWPAEQRLLRWLDDRPTPPVLLSVTSRTLAARSRAVAHQLQCGGPEEVRRTMELLPIDYLVVYATDLRSCPELAELGAAGFVPVKRFGTGTREISVLALGPEPPRPRR